MSGCHRFFLIAPLQIREVLRPDIFPNLLRNFKYSRLKLHIFTVLTRTRLHSKPRLVSSSFMVFPDFGQIPQILDSFTHNVTISRSVPKKPPWLFFGNETYIYFKPQLVLSTIKVLTNFCRIPQIVEYLSYYVTNFSSVPKKPPWFTLGLQTNTYYPSIQSRTSDKVPNTFLRIHPALDNSLHYLIQNSSANIKPPWHLETFECKTITKDWKGINLSISQSQLHFSKRVSNILSALQSWLVLPPLGPFRSILPHAHCRPCTRLAIHDAMEPNQQLSRSRTRKPNTRPDLAFLPGPALINQRIQADLIALSSLLHDATAPAMPRTDPQQTCEISRSVDPPVTQPTIKFPYARMARVICVPDTVIFTALVGVPASAFLGLDDVA